MKRKAVDTAISRRSLSVGELRQLFELTAVDQTVTTEEAAALLGVAPQTMRRWACQGSGPLRPRHVNSRLRWSVADIRGVLADGSPAGKQ